MDLKSPRKLIFLLVAVVLLSSTACWSDGSKLVVGDVVGVAVDGEKEFSKTYQINRDGCVTVAMVGAVKVLGFNTSDAAVAISNALGKVLVNPQVTVGFVERAKMQVFVVGEVKKAGLVEIGAGDRVMQALAQAGYDAGADLSRVSIRRGNEIIDLDLDKYLQARDISVNAELQSGDTVVVPKADSEGNVMVLGQVSKVGSIPLKRGMTFREAMGLTGGVTVEADTDKICVKRDGAAEPILVDYKRAMEGDPSADVALQPKDTIYVPQIETSFFTVMGGVNRPGQYPLKGRLTVSEAIGLAGGDTPNMGDRRKVQLMRCSRADSAPGEIIKVDLTKVQGLEEPTVQRGDVVYVAIHKQKLTVLQIIQSLSPLAWLLR